MRRAASGVSSGPLPWERLGRRTRSTRSDILSLPTRHLVPGARRNAATIALFARQPLRPDPRPLMCLPRNLPRGDVPLRCLAVHRAVPPSVNEVTPGGAFIRLPHAPIVRPRTRTGSATGLSLSAGPLSLPSRRHGRAAMSGEQTSRLVRFEACPPLPSGRVCHHPRKERPPRRCRAAGRRTCRRGIRAFAILITVMDITRR